MWTRKRSPCEPHRRAPENHAPQTAFTLIELLVVVAIIALLLSILLPSLQGAREQARIVVCGQRLHDFGIGLATYTAENDEWVPGVNTSGVAVRALELVWSNPTVLYRPDLPVQSWDWMTPLLAHQLQMPAVRAKKWRYLLNEMRCPTQTYSSAIYDGGNTSPDLNALEAEGPYRSVSYLMPAHFQYVGQDHKNEVLAYKDHPAVQNRPIVALAAYELWECINYSFLPRVDRVGPPASKIFVADGMRYFELEGGTQELDFDAYPHDDRSEFGSFSTTGAWWCGSPAYGVEQGTLNWNGDTVNAGTFPKGRGQNMALSYRHGTRSTAITSSAQSNEGSINALMFDGHVERLNDRKSREITYWYPSGSIVQTPGEGMTYAEQDMVIP